MSEIVLSRITGRFPGIAFFDEILDAHGFVTRIGEFEYDPGIPTAKAFVLRWHATKAEADARINPITDPDIILPTHRFIPEFPEAGSSKQTARVEITLPELLVLEMDFYGSICIEQEIPDDPEVIATTDFAGDDLGGSADSGAGRVRRTRRVRPIYERH